MVFSAYFQGFPGAIAQGGRYDGVGEAFGRARQATGFSLDLRAIASLTEREKPASVILAPHAANDDILAARIEQLRAEGNIVIELLPDEISSTNKAQGEGPLCDRRLAQENGHWVVIQGN